ncbi:phosphate/phosphite/phosphonate ABC transporter substrate-binding protein [Alkalicoccus daliensis]|uniref:Phosphonate transport system substrate-binding protein n=1 Tax=Alkalicoccus daliensis TaxID=745820 RepID=A0A1G9ZH78_9BACI|nr:phosphate/phosphite/phosphonate ABC transporter substrate-binding protein [Alkalicoccus daliensis]SDN20679.1 phosphonate transport system substrate-binding protein [Alkalicoccus daliensis]
MKKSILPLAGAALFLTACGADNETNSNENNNATAGNNAGSEELYEVAVIPSQSIGEMEEGLTRLEDHLADSMDREVEVTHYPSYNAVVEAINFGHVDLAYFGPVTYLIAYEQSGAEAILTQNIDGEPYYYSYIITQPDAPWESLDDLLEDAGEVEFAFGSQSSTSGFAVPGYELMQRGVYESESTYEFESVQFTGSHDITADAVASGSVDAGAIDSAIFNALIDDGLINEDDYKILWESDQLYQYPWAVPAETDEDTIAAVQEAFMEIEDEEILNIFGGADSFVEASPDEYESILEAARALELLELEEEEDEEEANEEDTNDEE